MKTVTLTPKTSFLSSATAELNSLFKSKQTFQIVRISLIFLGLNWVLFGAFYHLFPPMIPLFYSRPWGEAQLLPKQHFIIVPAILTLLFIIHIRLASKFLVKNKMITFITLWTQLLLEGLIFIILIKLIFLLA